MLLSRLHWLPVLIVLWMNLRSGAALSTYDERNSHVTTNTFHPSILTSTMTIHQNYNRRAHPSDGKNVTQPNHKLVASPAGLLRPDKFQFYTYNDNGDMITRQMTVQEIQGLIAAGGADHIANRQEPQKADDIFTDGKKVMDVVQKVQNVLKSALDKPPSLTGSIPKIPEHANVEWSNILPSILSGETDAISSGDDQSLHKLTTEKTEDKYSITENIFLTESASNIGINATDASNDFLKGKEPVIQSGVQTNAYAGFANNAEHNEKLQYSYHSQQIKPAVSAFSEKPMIPVPVITPMEQKLSTFQSTVTKSPIFQMLSVIPVEAAESTYTKEDQVINSVTTESTYIDSSSDQIEHMVKLTLSKVPESSTLSTSSDMHFANVTKQITANLDNGVIDQKISTTTYSTITQNTSTSSTINTKQTVTYDETTIDKVSSNVSYALPQNMNTKPFKDPSFASSIIKEPQVNDTRNDNKVIPYNNTATLRPLSHSTIQKPEEGSKITVLQSMPSTSESRIKISSTTPISPHADRFSEGFSTVMEEVSIKPVTSMNVEDYRHPLSTEIPSSASVEPLPTQLVDSLSSVMNQITEAQRPPVLSLASISDHTPQISTVDIDYNRRRNATSDKITLANANTPQYNTFTSNKDMNENIEHIVSSQTYATVTIKSPLSQNDTTRIVDSTTQWSIASIMNRESIVNTETNDVSIKPSAPTTIVTMKTANNLPTTASGSTVDSINTIIKQSTTLSPIWIQLEKVRNASLINQTEASVPLETTTVNEVTEKQAIDSMASFEKISFNMNESLSELAQTNFGDTLASLNWSDPMSTIDQVLNLAPLPSDPPSITSISLPNDTSSFVASDLASGLIAGFATSTSERSSFEESNEDHITEVVSSAHKIQPTDSVSLIKFVESIKNATQTHKELTKLNINDNSQEKRNVTSTQIPLLTNVTENGTSELNMQINKSNNTCSILVNDNNLTRETEIMTNVNSNCRPSVTTEKIVTKESIELLNNNERIDNSTKISLFSSSDKLTNVESKNSTGQNTVAVNVVTIAPEKPSTTDIDIQLLSDDKTSFNISYNKYKKDNREKVRTTETPIVITNLNPEFHSRLPTKTTLIDSTYGNNTNKKDDAFVNATKISVGIYGQYQNSLYEHRNNVTISEIASSVNNTVPSNENSINSALSQNANRTNNVVPSNKNNELNMNTHVATDNHTSHISIQANKDYSVNSSSSSVSLSIDEDTSIDNPSVKIVAQKLSGNTSEDNESFHQSPNNDANYSNFTNNTTDHNNKIVLSGQYEMQTVSMSNASMLESSIKNSSMQLVISEQSNKTENVSLKHSENTSKPDVIRLQLSTPPSNVPERQMPKPVQVHKFSEKLDTLKTDLDVNTDDKWTLISQQTPSVVTKLPKPPRLPKPTRKPIGHIQTSTISDNDNINIHLPETTANQQDDLPPFPQEQPMLPLDASQSANGLDITVKRTSADIVNFARLCNELALNFWVATNKGLSTARSLALSPFGMTSLLAMIFLGARGLTSDQMNEVLGLDDVATFNPHLVFQNITDTVSLARGQGIANAAFVRELFADKMKVRKLMPFYKEQAQQFYEGLVTEVNFATISDLVRRRTNLLVRKQTGGRIKDFVKTNTVPLRSPLAALSANVFQTDCNTTLTSSVGRDGELYFAVSPAVRQRRLVPVPATTWRSGVLAGYEPSIDATVVALGGSERLVSTIFLLPGQQGHTAPGDTLDRLEQRLVKSAFRDSTWNKLLKVLIPRNGLELQIPKFSHRSVVNATAALKRMGLDELFSGNADFKGINGVGHRLHLADVLQMNLFSTCGDENIFGGRHHVETYPASPLRSIRRRIEENNFDKIVEDDTLRQHSDVLSQESYLSSLYIGQSRMDQFHREKRQLSSLERPRLKLDRPFLYFVRHNPSGMILHMGRFNPRLLP